MGHEDDKGDKLLITEVSDLDYISPSSAAKDITEILLNPIVKKIENELSKIDSLLTDRICDEYNKSYNILYVIRLFYKSKNKFYYIW